MNNEVSSPFIDAPGDHQARPYVPYQLIPATTTLWLERGAWLGGVARRLADIARRSGHPATPSRGT